MRVGEFADDVTLYSHSGYRPGSSATFQQQQQTAQRLSTIPSRHNSSDAGKIHPSPGPFNNHGFAYGTSRLVAVGRHYLPHRHDS